MQTLAFVWIRHLLRVSDGTVLALVLASVAAVCGASAVVLRADPPRSSPRRRRNGGQDVGARSPLARPGWLGSIGVLGRVGGASLDARLRRAGDTT
jgi:hypothetical protein